MLHENFCYTTAGPIRRMVTSEKYPPTAHAFYFWTAETRTAPQPGDTGGPGSDEGLVLDLEKQLPGS